VPLTRSAGVITSLTKADGILEVSQDTERIVAGESVNVRLMRSEEEIRRTIVVTGSHDPLLDELADIARANHLSISSTHVGSMGGVMAMMRGEAHLSGIHLLDEVTGTYNQTCYKEYFSDSSVQLYRGVKRIQGLIVQKGNPKGIQSIADLARDDLRFINRQRGSGTRILLDYLLRAESIDSCMIDGYSREEYTHLSVSAKIASDDCDAGLGIFSAAKVYDLDFIEVAEEDYDLLVNSYFSKSNSFAQLLTWLVNSEFTQRMDRLGGYSYIGIGERLL